MARGSRARIALALVLLVLAAIFVPPLVNVNRYRARITASIERALGRPVTVGGMSLRMFPQPGFELQNVSVGEDPAFGAEPMLHAEEVRANLRLSSLWRGKLEIAKLTLKYPSFNLVRAGDGRWNLENLLEHAARIPTAPTTKVRPESRPRFPYIEADGGRINFKDGVEKKVYALADADFSLWLASEDELRTRLKGRMVRTDSYLSDTGEVTFEGRFQRAWDLRDTPMEVTLLLEDAQLGQLTKFVDGQDHGWRGAVNAKLTLTGRPSALKVTLRGGLNDFRRYDISTTENVSFQGNCTASLDVPGQKLNDVACELPLGGGKASAKGSIEGFGPRRAYLLKVAVDKVPVQTLLSVVRQAKKDVSADLSASGTADAAFELRKDRNAASHVWSGTGSTTNIVVRSAELQPQLELKAIQFAVQQQTQKGRNRTPKALHSGMESNTLVTAPFLVAMGAEGPVRAGASIAAEGCELSLQGDAQVSRLLQLARVTGVPALNVNADGAAKVDITVVAGWRRSPKVIGVAQVGDTTVRIKGISEPLRISGATINFGQDSVTATNLAAEFKESHLVLSGWVKRPRECSDSGNCPIQFNLTANQIVADNLNLLLNPRAAKRPWYAVLGSNPEPSFLGRLHATGQVSTAQVAVKSLIANRVTAQASLKAGLLTLTNVRADLLSGAHIGEWKLDFSGDQPTYTGSGSLDSLAIPQVAALMRDNWATGKVSGTYHVSLTGSNTAQILASAKGDLAFDWQGGVLRHVSLAGSDSPLSFRRFVGTLEWQGNQLRLGRESKMQTDGGIYQVSGTASLGRGMDLVMRNGSRAFSVSGTLDKPKVTPAPVTQAQVSLNE